jgi:hypothetical protein
MWSINYVYELINHRFRDMWVLWPCGRSITNDYQWLPMIIVSIRSIILWRTWFLTLEYRYYSSEHRFADIWVLLAGQLPIIMVKLDHFCVVCNAIINVLCNLGSTSLWTTIWMINYSFWSYKIPSHSCVGQPIIL